MSVTHLTELDESRIQNLQLRLDSFQQGITSSNEINFGEYTIVTRVNAPATSNVILNGHFPGDSSDTGGNTFIPGTYGSGDLSAKSIILGNNIKIIGKRAFYNVLSLQGEIYIPQLVTEIRDESFMGTSITALTFHFSSYLTKIGERAFKNTKLNYNNIVIPSSVNYIGVEAFSNISNIPNIYVDGPASIFKGNVFLNSYGVLEMWNTYTKIYVNPIYLNGYPPIGQPFQGGGATIQSWDTYPDTLPIPRADAERGFLFPQSYFDLVENK